MKMMSSPVDHIKNVNVISIPSPEILAQNKNPTTIFLLILIENPSAQSISTTTTTTSDGNYNHRSDEFNNTERRE
jgi:hypothetical protein